MYKEGDKLEAVKDGVKYTGIVMPSYEKNVLVLKLENGYNVGLKIDFKLKIKKIGSAKLGQFPTAKYIKNKKLPNVSLITTGGTITSKVDYKTGAVSPLIKVEELLCNIPELSKVVNLSIQSPFSLLSEDMSSKEWVKLAGIVVKELNKKDVKGVIVTHGTDTLHYTAAALSFMIKDLNKPVALVGGQRSSDRGSFDGAMNLVCAARYCLSDCAEVAVVMHGESGDTFCLANPGTKVRKMHTSRRDAFRPINSKPIAKIHHDGKIEFLKKYKKRSSGKAKLDAGFENKIALVKFFPGASPDIINHYIKNKYKGVIIEATGLGHVSVNPLNKKNSWLNVIEKAVKSRMFVGFAPQCLYGRLDPYVYSNARVMVEKGVVYLGDMLPETAFIKLGWALSKTKKVKELMLKNIANEINEREEKDMFLF